MKLIKLNAIDSTNEYIKKIKSHVSDKFFCVYTYSQTNGKGQRGNIWESEPNKNICISLCYKPLTCEPNYTSFKLNMLVSLIILEFFEELKIPKLKVKWPNDILSDGKKISGILIETALRSNNINDYIIGIGLNINQNNFDNINNASSIKNITGIDYDLNHLTTRLINFFEDLDTRFNQNSIDDIKSEYVNNLYGNNSVIKFVSDQKELHGKIIDVISENKIKLLVNDKEIVFSSGDLKLIF